MREGAEDPILLYAVGVLELYRKAVWDEALLDPVDQCLKGSSRLATTAPGTVAESGDLEIPIEVTSIRSDLQSAIVVFCGALDGDDTVRLEEKRVSIYYCQVEKLIPHTSPW